MYQWETHKQFYWANLKENNPSVDVDIEGRISKWILNMAGCCEHEDAGLGSKYGV
jgi:hypothetical protein